jgi:DNA-binding protein YbaB
MTWDYRALRDEIDRAVRDHADLVARERVTVEAGPVTAVLTLDGVLADVVIDPRALRRQDELGELVTTAIRAAEHEAAARRAVLAEKVTYLGQPVLEVVREMSSDPRAAVRRLATD